MIMQQDKSKYMNEADGFSKLARQKMKDHRVAVDADCWDKIEQQLKPKNNRRVMLWATGAVAAAVALLIFLFVPSGSSDFDKLDAELHYTKLLPDIMQQKEQDRDTDNERKGSQDLMIKKSSGSVRLISQQASKAVLDNDGSSGTTQPVENILLTIDTVQLADIGNHVAMIMEPDRGSELPVADSIPSQDHKIIKENNEPTRILIEKTKKQDKWLLAASFSSGGSSSSEGVPRNSYGMLADPLPPAMNLKSSPEVYTTGVMSYDEFTNVSHSLPISFGVTVRKDINDRIALETGLVYTYLSSKFSNNGTINNNAKQELHYMGIPVNAVVYLWNNRNWNVYASIGGMGEKGLKLNYTQNILQTNTDNSLSRSVKEDIKGLQWSVNASVGVTYKFYQNWGFYFEPRYSYYFDNNQPFSIRTENSRVFGLSAGFRYEF
jgi:hypothetical protein